MPNSSFFPCPGSRFLAIPAACAMIRSEGGGTTRSTATEGMQSRGCMLRIRKCVVDLLTMEDDLIDEDAWELMGNNLRLKSTFLYCDLSQVIANSREERKQALTDLANKLFHYMEELDHAVQSRSVSMAHACYIDTALVLQEVLAALLPLG